MVVTRDINEHIFRGYDIRGIYNKDLDINVAFTIGKAYGTVLKRKYFSNKVIVGQDNRLSSPMLASALMEGIISTGVDVVYLGTVTSSMLYYANELYKIYSGIMVTASHNPKEYNGFKIAFDKNGEICGEEIQEFKKVVLDNDFENIRGRDLGKIETISIKEEYASMIISKFNFNVKKKVVIDCGNGTASVIVKDIFSKLNLNTEYLFCESDPNFPNHHPDPAEEKNLTKLKQVVLDTNADLGIAFDGDADRVGIIDEKGNMVPSDYYLAIISKNILKTVENKKVIFDVNCSKTLYDEVVESGGEPIVFKTGNSYIKREMLRQSILFGGEISGHTFFYDKFYGFDDGIYAGLRMVELLVEESKKMSELVEELVHYNSTPIIKVKVPDEHKAEVIEKVRNYCIGKDYNINTIDGVRIEFEDGFAVVRMSNTTPNLTLRFEARDNERLDQIKSEFINLVDKFVNEI